MIDTIATYWPTAACRVCMDTGVYLVYTPYRIAALGIDGLDSTWALCTCPAGDRAHAEMLASDTGGGTSTGAAFAFDDTKGA